jgi:hypothetical protein
VLFASAADASATTPRGDCKDDAFRAKVLDVEEVSRRCTGDDSRLPEAPALEPQEPGTGCVEGYIHHSADDCKPYASSFITVTIGEPSGAGSDVVIDQRTGWYRHCGLAPGRLELVVIDDDVRYHERIPVDIVAGAATRVDRDTRLEITSAASLEVLDAGTSRFAVGDTIDVLTVLALETGDELDVRLIDTWEGRAHGQWISGCQSRIGYYEPSVHSNPAPMPAETKKRGCGACAASGDGSSDATWLLVALVVGLVGRSWPVIRPADSRR